MNMSKKLAAGIFLGLTVLAGNALAAATNSPDTIILKEGNDMKLEQGWDKTFPKSDKVDHRKVTFQKPLRHHPCGRPVYSQGR